MLMRTILSGALAALAVLGAPAADQAQEPAAKRISAIAAVAVEEYAKGVDASGRVVSEVEFAEATGFLRDAQDAAKRLTLANAGAVRQLLDSLVSAASRRALPAELAALRGRLVAALGAEGALDLPTRAVDLARGKAIFEQACLSCHGSSGMGDGPQAAKITPRPAPIGSAAAMREKAPALLYRTVSVGIQGTPMVAWAGALPPDDRWAVVSYINSMRASDADRKAGAALLSRHCASCATRSPPPAQTFVWQAERSDMEIAAAIAAADPETGVRDGGGLSAEDLGRMVTALRASPVVTSAATASGPPKASNDPGDAAREVTRLLDAALAAARGGRAVDAGNFAFDTYIAFEPLEGPARMRDPGLVATMERHFADFKSAVKANDLRAAEESRLAIERGMPRVLALATPASTYWGAFLESFLIIVREGFEAILVIGAVVAFLIKTGNRSRLRDIWWGGGIGLAASAVLAVLMRTILSAVPASQDITEGVTMLVAVVVLFFVSYWLLSKVEGARWQKFISDKVNSALSNGSNFALAFVAFLAVFREGAETALFYQALFARGGEVVMPVSLGLLAGLASLAVVFMLFYRFGVKIPLRPFFAVTSALLYFMAFVFAGKGIAELQEAGVLSRTLVPRVPHIDAIGLYPTAETLVAQGVLVVLLVFALWYSFRTSPADDGDGGDSVPGERATRLA